MRQAARPQINPQQVRKSLLTWGSIIAVLAVVFYVGWGVIWREGVIRPMLNGLLFLYANLGQSFILAITALTLLLRLLTSPLQFKQIRTSRRMADLQPLIAELQKKYGGDKARLAQEQQKLYREAGASPFSGCLPTLVQFPIWISLYQSINSILADTPLELMNLGKNVYAGFEAIVRIVPLQRFFLGMDLAHPDPSPFILPVLVAGTMWLQQKMMAQPASDSQQASMNQSMQLMMPLMFGYMTTQFSSGLAIYFVISNVVGTAMYWAISHFEGSRADDVSKSVDTSKSKSEASNGPERRRAAKG